MSLHQEFAAFIEEFKAKRMPKAAPPPAPAPFDVDAAVARLAILEAEYDPSAQFADEYGVWLKHDDIRRQIDWLKGRIAAAAMVDNHRKAA